MAYDFREYYYSPERKGPLLEYLRRSTFGEFDNSFKGLEYFFIIKDMNLILPNITSLRVNMSPIPDLAYYVNEDFMLQSSGPGDYNMSCMGAVAGTYNPKEVLHRKIWSIYDLNIDILFLDNPQ